MKIVNVHFHKTNNIGDVMCAPALVFPKWIKYETGWNWRPTDDCFVIFGGGGFITRPEHKQMNEILASPFVKGSAVFGAGHNSHNLAEFGRWPNDLKDVDLVGVRDRADILPPFAEHVPCTSCLHPVFDSERDRKITNKVVIYSHQSRPIGPNFNNIFPEEFNTGRKQLDFVKNIRFIASAEYVITNTYHGAYWSLLLGKKVILYDLWATRMMGMTVNSPIIRHPNELQRAMDLLEAPQAPIVMLKRDRQIVNNFADKIKKQIDIASGL